MKYIRFCVFSIFPVLCSCFKIIIILIIIIIIIIIINTYKTPTKGKKIIIAVLFQKVKIQ